MSIWIGKEKFNYSSDSDCGGHIVDEVFKFIPRPIEFAQVCNYFGFRVNCRKMSKLPKDKRNNRVVAIPGSPGIGKSSFLTHFPESQEYYEYLNKVSPIVSTLTFNSGMECEKDLFGLRILFGASRAMELFAKSKILHIQPHSVSFCEISSDGSLGRLGTVFFVRIECGWN